MAKEVISLLTLIVLTLSISAQSPIDDYDDDGRTPLLTAVIEHQNERVRSLLNEGADPNKGMRDGLHGTPLMYSTWVGDMQICRMLLDAGADVNAIDKNNDHALNWASFYGRAEVMDFLIEAGTDLTLRSKHGDAVDVTLRLWHADSVRDVFYYTDMADEMTEMADAITDAVRVGDIATVDSLISSGASPDIRDAIGVPLLQIAAEQGDELMTRTLLAHGADADILNRVGQTPLAWAARFGHHKVMKILLSAGANPNMTDDEYRLTPLIGAAINGNVNIGELLINGGAQLDHQERINRATALQWAYWYGQRDFTKILLQNGAEFWSSDSGMSLYDMVKANEKNTDLKVLMDSIWIEDREIEGSWKVYEIQYEYSDTTYIANDLDYGRFIFSDRRYSLMYNPAMQERTPFANLSKPTDEELISGFRSIVFNSGSYMIEDGQIVTTPDIAKVPGFESGRQYYDVQWVDTGQLQLTMADETYPSGDKPEWFGKLKIHFLMRKE